MTCAFRLAASGCFATALAVAVQGCATLDQHAIAASHRLDEAPYYVALAEPQPVPGSCALVYPVTLDIEFESSFGYAGRSAELTALVDALNARLAQRKDPCVRQSPAPAAGVPPRIYFGSADSEYAPPEAEAQRLPTDRFSPMVLHIARPDGAWRANAAESLALASVPYGIVVKLGVSQYMKGYSSALRKEVVLGTDHREPIKFLTAEDKPVEVLHLTGVLVDAGGTPIRAGAEGIVLRDTPFMAQTVDVMRVFDTEELRRVLESERRGDLAGAPLKWQVALDNLLAQLLRQDVRTPARR